MKVLDAIKKLNGLKNEDDELLIETIDLKELKGAKEKDLAEAFMTAIESLSEEDSDKYIPEELAELYNKLAGTEDQQSESEKKAPEKKATKAPEKKATKAPEKKAPEKKATKAPEKKAPEKTSQSGLMNQMLKDKADHKAIVKALVKMTGKDEEWATKRLKAHLNWQKNNK